MEFFVITDQRANRDIQKAIDYYDEQRVGLGRRFENLLNEYLILLQTNPFFAIRYNNVRCLPLKKFPYMIHFTVNEEKGTVTVHAIFHTSINPKNWKDRF